MASEKEIKEIIESIRKRRNLWILSPRPKNLKTLSALGIDKELAFDIINTYLTLKDYVKGPEADNHSHAIPGNIWVFGLTVENKMCYLKFQDRKDKQVFWISFHEAQHTINFPYQ